MEPLDRDLEEGLLELPSEPMMLNMGPSHPAMHGTVRIVLELSGETIQKADVQIGYLHRGFEKMCERGTWSQIFPYVDRCNYVSPMLNNVGFALAVEKMLGVTVPERCQYYRVALGELARICDHMICSGAMCMELGAFTPFLYFARAREIIWDIFEEETGASVTMIITDADQYATKLQAAIACNKVPDVFYIEPGRMQGYVYANVLADLTSYVEQDVLDSGVAVGELRGDETDDVFTGEGERLAHGGQRQRRHRGCR